MRDDQEMKLGQHHVNMGHDAKPDPRRPVLLRMQNDFPLQWVTASWIPKRKRIKDRGEESDFPKLQLPIDSSQDETELPIYPSWYGEDEPEASVALKNKKDKTKENRIEGGRVVETKLKESVCESRGNEGLFQTVKEKRCLKPMSLLKEKQLSQQKKGVLSKMKRDKHSTYLKEKERETTHLHHSPSTQGRSDLVNIRKSGGEMGKSTYREEEREGGSTKSDERKVERHTETFRHSVRVCSFQRPHLKTESQNPKELKELKEMKEMKDREERHSSTRPCPKEDKGHMETTRVPPDQREGLIPFPLLKTDGSRNQRGVDKRDKRVKSEKGVDRRLNGNVDFIEWNKIMAKRKTKERGEEKSSSRGEKKIDRQVKIRKSESPLTGDDESWAVKSHRMIDEGNVGNILRKNGEEIRKEREKMKEEKEKDGCMWYENLSSDDGRMSAPVQQPLLISSLANTPHEINNNIKDKAVSATTPRFGGHSPDLKDSKNQIETNPLPNDSEPSGYQYSGHEFLGQQKRWCQMSQCRPMLSQCHFVVHGSLNNPIINQMSVPVPASLMQREFDDLQIDEGRGVESKKQHVPKKGSRRLGREKKVTRNQKKSSSSESNNNTLELRRDRERSKIGFSRRIDRKSGMDLDEMSLDEIDLDHEKEGGRDDEMNMRRSVEEVRKHDDNNITTTGFDNRMIKTVSNTSSMLSSSISSSKSSILSKSSTSSDLSLSHVVQQPIDDGPNDIPLSAEQQWIQSLRHSMPPLRREMPTVYDLIDTKYSNDDYSSDDEDDHYPQHHKIPLMSQRVSKGHRRRVERCPKFAIPSHTVEAEELIDVIRWTRGQLGQHERIPLGQHERIGRDYSRRTVASPNELRSLYLGKEGSVEWPDDFCRKYHTGNSSVQVVVVIILC